MNRMMMFLCLLLLTVFGVTAVRAESPYAKADTPLTLFAVNVGKGDALLLNCGSDTYLIDAGLQDNWSDLSRALAALQVEKLTGVILTHTDKDHAGGLLPLATSSIEVGGWYASKHFTGKESKHPAVEAAALRGEKVTFLRTGDVLPLGNGKLTVVGPIEASDVENCNSLVLVAEAGGGRMLLTGDMEFPEEKQLLKTGSIPPCDVIKIANHGEADATSEALLNAVRPSVAVISTSTDAEHDTPSSRVLTLLAHAGAKMYQTQDAQSGVLVTIDQGEVTANLMDYGDLADPVKGVSIAEVDNQDDRIILCNTGKTPADVSGWFIVSDKGNQIYVLPKGTEIAPGGELVIGSQSSAEKGDLTWPDKKVWHKSKEDAAYLYDVYGRLIDSMD